MSVLIEGMEMPTSCATCKLFGEYGCPLIGTITYALTRGKRHKDCPLVEVPDHGRLIDANALFKEFELRAWYNNADRDLAEDFLLDAPTVIPAEPPKEETK